MCVMWRKYLNLFITNVFGLKGCSQIKVLIDSKKGKLYLKFLVAAALLFTLAFALYTLAANPSASPAIVSDRNFSNSNVSVAFDNNVIFGFATGDVL